MTGTRAESDRLSDQSRLQAEAQRQRDELLWLRGEVGDLRNQLAERLAAAALAAARARRALPDPADASFQFADAKDVGMRTPMATLQTRWWAGRAANFERFRETWVEAPEASEREKKRGLRAMETSYKALSGKNGTRWLEDYQESRLLRQELSDDESEIELTVQSRGTAGWQSGSVRLRRVGDEWKFLMLMQTNVLTPDIPE
jgi:hypothetical protein